jgi:hypothetical protein
MRYEHLFTRTGFRGFVVAVDRNQGLRLRCASPLAQGGEGITMDFFVQFLDGMQNKDTSQQGDGGINGPFLLSTHWWDARQQGRNRIYFCFPPPKFINQPISMAILILCFIRFFPSDLIICWVLFMRSINYYIVIVALATSKGMRILCDVEFIFINPRFQSWAWIRLSVIEAVTVHFSVSLANRETRTSME